MSITLTPPTDGTAPFKSFVLNNGTLIRPDFSRGGAVTVNDQDDVDELLAEGWRLDSQSEKAARFESNMLRKAAEAEMRRLGGVGTHPRVEFGEVGTGPRYGRVMVSHDRGEDIIVVHGVASNLADLDSDLRTAFVAASAAFNAAEDSAEQTGAKALIGVVVGAVLERHDFIGAKVRERQFNQRYDV